MNRLINYLGFVGLGVLIVVGIAAVRDETGNKIQWRLGTKITVDPNVTIADEDGAWSVNANTFFKSQGSGASLSANQLWSGINTNFVGTGGIIDTNPTTGSYTAIRGGWAVLTNFQTGSYIQSTNASTIWTNFQTGAWLSISNGVITSAGGGSNYFSGSIGIGGGIFANGSGGSTIWADNNKTNGVSIQPGYDLTASNNIGSVVAQSGNLTWTGKGTGDGSGLTNSPVYLSFWNTTVFSPAASSGYFIGMDPAISSSRAGFGTNSQFLCPITGKIVRIVAKVTFTPSSGETPVTLTVTNMTQGGAASGALNLNVASGIVSDQSADITPMAVNKNDLLNLFLTTPAWVTPASSVRIVWGILIQ